MSPHRSSISPRFATDRRACGQVSVLLIGLFVAAMLAAGILGVVAFDRGPSYSEGDGAEVTELREQVAQLSNQVRSMQEQLQRIEARPAVAVRDPEFPPGDRLAAEDPARPAPEDEAREGDRGDSERRQRGDWRGGFGAMGEMEGLETTEEKLALARSWLEDDNPMLRFAALRTLTELAPAEAAGAVLAIVESSADDRRGGWMASRAVAMLGDLESVSVQSELRQIYDTDNEDVRPSAARALEKQGDDSLMRREVTSATRGLAASDDGLRVRSIDDLGSTRSPLAVPHLMPLLADGNSVVRLRTLDALRQTGDESIIPQVEALLNDPVAHVRERAARTMESLREGNRGGDRRGGFGDMFRGGRGGRGGRN